MSALPELLTPSDASEYLGKSVDWCTRTQNARLIGGVKVGRSWRYTAHGLALYIERRADLARSARQEAARKREAKA